MSDRHAPRHGDIRGWAADPLTLMWILAALAALSLIVAATATGDGRAGAVGAGLAAVVAGVALSGST